MAAPGGLTELGEDAGAWDARVADKVARAGAPLALTAAGRGNATELRVPDWPAVPARIRACLGRQRADRLMDTTTESGGDLGRTMLQEEYAEWRVVRDDRGPVRFELTTELSDYWELLARHAPRTALDLVSGFAGHQVPAEALFGDHDPFGAASTGDERAAAFNATMLGIDRRGERVARRGPYNDGTAAITCLARGDNTLAALVRLVAGAAVPRLVLDSTGEGVRFPSGSEAIAWMPTGSAQDCRNSDPVVVERLTRLATEGRPIRFDDPVGVYILDVQGFDLLCPGDEPLPREWLELSRQGELADGLARHQRLTLDIPADAGFSLAQLRSARTGRTIEHGAQIAELVQLGVYLRVGDRESVPVDVSPRPAPETPACGGDAACEGVRRDASRLEEKARGVPEGA